MTRIGTPQKEEEYIPLESPVPRRIEVPLREPEREPERVPIRVPIRVPEKEQPIPV